jgi:sugar lactone lactonase YvrE
MKGLFAHGTRAAFLACVLFTTRAEAQTSLEIYAGGTPFVDAPANTVPVSPKALALAPNGHLYVADDASGKVLRFDPATATISSVPNLPGMLEYRFATPQGLGYGPGAVLNLMASQEQWQLDLVDGFRNFLGPVGPAASVTFGPDGSMYFSRPSEHAVYRRTPSGSIVTLAGNTLPGFSGDGTTSVRFNNPRGVAIDAAGNVYIADSGNHRVRRRAAATGIITTVAGRGITGYNGENLPALLTNLSAPTLLAIDAAGNLYIYEANGLRIRRLNAATGRITNFAGNGSSSSVPGNGGLAVNSSINGVADMEIAGNGTLYIAEADSYRVRKVDTSGIISQVVGSGMRSFCGEGVPAREACLNRPNGITIDDAGDVYVSDQYNRRIRKISAATGLITTIAGANDTGPDGDGGPASAARLPNGPAGITVDAARNLYVAVNGRVRRIDAATGIISAFAGTTTPGFSGDGGPAIAARFNGVSRVALDSSGNVYISDIYNNRVRRVNAATGIITTVAGNGSNTGALGDGGLAIHASLAWPHNLAFDPDGNLLIGDTNHYRIRKVNLTSGVITTIAGNGNSEITGNGLPAIAAGIGNWPAFDVDADGNIYVTAGFELRRIDAHTGIIDRVPAPMWGLYTPEGRSLENPNDMVLGADNRLYITDAATNNLVLRVSDLPTPAGDLTPPVIESVVSGTLGANGWYRGDVQISWSVDELPESIEWVSGCGTYHVTSDTTGISYTCGVQSAGGFTSKTVSIKRDATAPAITIVSPADGATYAVDENVASGFSCTDVSPQGCTGTAANGAPLDTSTPGTKTFTVDAIDLAGNTSTLVHSYSVQ